ncbi:hypothetical protein Pmani_020572 [Petrolisthes manimaculis]|uniref:C2H2-type domain-containing protein n=1 Tax=Petrolisthes manimaculis TaxID=1843537 RepID=A0AAE1PFZ4_9EUCA|nr:hypothetical protein Pmani_020572 [Petrolisthes manimaculis]
MNRNYTVCKDDGRSTLVKCKECNEAYPTLNNYREHLLVQHRIEAHKTHHEFTSEKEFLAWKGSIEMDVGVNYTTHGGSWKSSEGKKQIFYCRRSDKFSGRHRGLLLSYQEKNFTDISDSRKL